MAVGFIRLRLKKIVATSTGSATPTTGILPFYNNGDIINSWCVNTSGDGGTAWGHGCITQKMMQQNGGDWYIGDSITGSGNDNNGATGNSLTGLQVRNDYPSGNTVVQYNPSGTITRGSCSNFNPGLSWNGISVSASATICPSNEQPAFNGNTGFGANGTAVTASPDRRSGLNCG